MRHTHAMGLLAALAAGLISLPAMATTVDFGPVGLDGLNQPFSASVTSGFDDFYTFTLLGDGVLSASATNSYTFNVRTGVTKGFINDFTFALYSGTPTGPSSLISSATLGTVATPAVSGTTSFQLQNAEAAGPYFYEVSGTAVGPGTAAYGGSVTIDVSSVPLPPALPMFGAALLATAVAGYGFKRKAAKAA
jgi:hypothetical protein